MYAETITDKPKPVRLNAEPFYMHYQAWEAAFAFIAQGWHCRPRAAYNEHGVFSGWDVWGWK